MNTKDLELFCDSFGCNLTHYLRRIDDPFVVKDIEKFFGDTELFLKMVSVHIGQNDFIQFLDIKDRFYEAWTSTLRMLRMHVLVYDATKDGTYGSQRWKRERVE